MGIWTKRQCALPTPPKYLAVGLPPWRIMLLNNGSGLSQSGHAQRLEGTQTFQFFCFHLFHMSLHLQISVLD